MTNPGTFESIPGDPHGADLAELARLFPQYEVLELLGRGGMGAVFKARQKSLDRLVALKVLPRHIAEADPSFASRFQREARTMARMSHPGIVPVHDFGEAAGEQLYFVMELIEGTDVEKRLDREGPLPVPEAVRIAEAVCDALSYAHERGVVHRDIKPANVLIRDDGRVLVADFGLAKAGEALAMKLTRTDVAMGTQAFAAPELLTPGAKVDHRADLYSLGVMLYEMLTGEIPRAMFKLPSRCRPELGTRFDALICKALETDPADRFQNAAEFRDALPTALSPAVPLQRGNRKLRWLAVAAGIVILGAIPFTLRQAKKPKASVAPASVSPVSEPRAMKLWNIPQAARWEGDAMRLDNCMAITKPPYARDAVIRAAIKMNPDALSPSLSLRGFADNGIEGRYSAGVFASEKKVRLQAFSTKHVVLREWPLPRTYDPDEWVRLQLRAVGDELTVSLDGEVLGSIHDDTIANAGMAQVYAKRAGFFRDIVYVPLDKPAGTAVPVITNWLDMTEAVREKARTIPKLIVEPGAVRHTGSGNQVVIPLTPSGVRDYAIRLRFTSDGEIGLRSSPDAFIYVLCQRNQTIFHHYDVATGVPVLLRPNLPHPADFDSRPTHEMLVTMQGPTMRTWLDGRFLGEAQDTKCKNGDAKLVFTTSTIMHQVEIAELDAGTGEARSIEPGAIRLWDTPEKLEKKNGVTWELNAMRLDKALVENGSPLMRDAVVRALVRMNSDANSQSISLRGSVDARYVAGISMGRRVLMLEAFKDQARVVIREWPLPRSYGEDEWVPLELRVVGDALTVTFDGKALETVHDSTIVGAGRAQAYALHAGFFRDVVVVPLDQPSSATTEK